MKFSVYQVQTTRAQSDHINAVGWGGLSDEGMDSMRAKQELMLDGAEAYETWMFSHFKLVAKMTEVSNLEEVFHLGNGYGDQSKMERVERMHSVSVGDVIFCEDTNTWLMCDPCGWTGISVKEVA